MGAPWLNYLWLVETQQDGLLQPDYYSRTSPFQPPTEIRNKRICNNKLFVVVSLSRFHNPGNHTSGHKTGVSPSAPSSKTHPASWVPAESDHHDDTFHNTNRSGSSTVCIIYPFAGQVEAKPQLVSRISSKYFKTSSRYSSPSRLVLSLLTLFKP